MKDQFILFYVKDDEVLPVSMSESRLNILQRFIPVIFNGETPQIIADKSQGKVETLMRKDSNQDHCEHCGIVIEGEDYTYTLDNVYLCVKCTEELKNEQL